MPLPEKLERWLREERHRRALVIGLTLLFAAGLTLKRLDQHYPVKSWLVWSYLQAWLLAIVFSIACTSIGFAILRAVGPRVMPLSERLVIGMATGVLVFFLCMFLGGLLHLYGVAFALALPAALALAGARPLLATLRRAWLHLAAARARARRLGYWQLTATLLGALGLLMVYVNILTPDNAAYDARWYHLPLAEHYAAAGAVERSPEGWFQAALPHLSSFLYLWPHLLSWLGTFHHVVMAAHIEFVLFLWTLASVPLLVRWMLPGVRAGVSWTAFFLISAIFVYDSTLSVAADHIAAFWAIPILLALRRALPSFEPRACALLGAMLAGAVLTKYQSYQLLAFPLLALAIAGAWRLVRALRGTERRWDWLKGLSLTAVVLGVVTMPHWLKNWVWYGDPLYPVLYRHLSVRPWHVDSAHLYQTLVERHFWRPMSTGVDRWRETIEAVMTFSFKPHDWWHLHRDWPTFGFLFTLSWLPMLLVRATRRMWTVFVAAHVGLIAWYLQSHQDRYLQILVPWMVAHLAAVIVAIWRFGWLARAPLLALLGIQIIWGYGAYFIPAHVYTRWPLARTIEFLATGYQGNLKDRFSNFTTLTEFGEIGQSVPPDGKVLIHRWEVHAGLRRMSVQDNPSWQGLINYGRLRSQREVYELLRSIGVTHVTWMEEDWHAEDSLAGDLRFCGFVSYAVSDERVVGRFRLAALPPTPPVENLGEKVVYAGCGGYSPGLYHLDDLTLPGFPPASARYPAPLRPLGAREQQMIELLAVANYVVTNPRCPRPVPPQHLTEFVKRAGRLDEQLFVRKRPLFD